MIVTPIKTNKVHPNSTSLFDLMVQSLNELSENSVIVISSKIVSLCENNVVPIEKTDKELLIKQESTKYLESSISKYGYHFTITKNTLIAAAGIDESNGDGNYVLWPKNPQQTANYIRSQLKQKFNIKNIGIIISDSTSTPLRIGTIGTFIAYSGFKPLEDYVGKPDLFGKPFSVSRANIASGLSASANVAMGEGAEQTPICLITDVDFVKFCDNDPSEIELKTTFDKLENDLFAPFLQNMPWISGDKD